MDIPAAQSGSSPCELPVELVLATVRTAAGDVEGAFESFLAHLSRFGVARGALLATEAGELVRVAGTDVDPAATTLTLHDGDELVGEIRLELEATPPAELLELLCALFGLALGRRARAWELELVQAAVAVNRAESFDAALAVLAETCCRVVGVSSANITVWDAHFVHGKIRAAAGLTRDLIGEHVGPGSISHQAVKQRAPVVQTRGAPEEGIPDRIRAAAVGYACTVSVPLMLEDNPWITFQVGWLEQPSAAELARVVAAIEKLEALTNVAFRSEQERERNAQHELLLAVIEAVPEGIWIRHGDEVTSNAAIRSILRIPEGEPVSVEQDVHPRRFDGTPVAPEDWPGPISRRTGEVAHARFLATIAGDERVLEFKAAPMADGYVGVLRDVTKEHGEQVLTRHFLETLFESLPIGVGVADLETGEIKSVNPALLELLGRDAADVVGLRQPYPWWDQGYDAGYLTTPNGTIETIFRHPDGGAVPVELLPFHVHGADGAPAWVVVLVRGTSERREFERQIIQSGKLAAIGELASGVAHEINNPLFAILGLNEFLLRDAVPGTKAHERLSLIQQTGLEIKEIVKALLDFARERTDELRPMVVRDVVAEAITLVRRTTAAKSVEIVEVYNGKPAPSLGSPNQIKQILLNLISNAHHAMDENGTITITVAPESAFVTVSVSDTGPGIPADVLPRIFEPFFTTKRDLGGTGLGLAVSHGIAEMHGGELTAESKPGCGATFRLRLPIVETPAP